MNPTTAQTGQTAAPGQRAQTHEAEEHLTYELRHDSKQLCQDAMAYFREYARENPETVALWCLGIGFVLGWKLKPW